jgi:hypothetical protein
METNGLAEPFTGVTVNGDAEPGLFPVVSTGVSTAPIAIAAQTFLDSLDATQRDATVFPVDDEEWRKWGNQHIYFRQGLSFEAMSDSQREAAFGLMQASLSAKGMQLSRDIMRLNETLGELNNNNFVEYGEWKFWLTIMGEPSATEPWGWQLDGHHLIINFFVQDEQVVMTPAFWGSEPVIAESGKYAGTSILQEEQEMGRQMMLSLTDTQQQQATLSTSKNGNNILTQAFSDNVIIDYVGLSAGDMSLEQKSRLLRLIALYVGNMKGEHATVSMADIAAHLGNTWFSWIGGTETDSVYYYRIQSPVILIEFDHETPVGLTHIYPPGVPYREHIHAVVRTPNGNDYGKDLLRQHYENHPH